MDSSMYEALQLVVLLTTYSVLIVHALARVAAMLPSPMPADVGPREGF